MPSAQKDQLFTLVKSLTKSEKRSFKLYVNRSQSGSEAKFLQLFEVLGRLAEYDEEQVLKRLPGVKKRHLPNLKRHLYKQILTSLRLIYIQKNIDIQIREQLDFARILYGKGMYMQSLRMLDRIKKTAIEHHQDILHLEILEFQKLIEARHITRSRLVENKMEALLDEAAQRSHITHYTHLFTNFNIQIHGWYIQNGHVKNEQEAKAVGRFFKEQLPKGRPPEQLTFFERANLFQAHMWYYYILLQFDKAALFARYWVGLFHSDEQMKEKDPGLYMRALYYLLVMLYLQRDCMQYEQVLEEFERFEQEYDEQLNDNSQMIAFVYLNLSRLNWCLLSGDFQHALALIPQIEARLPRYEAYTDVHRTLLFQFKFAYLFFHAGQYEKALEYLNEIIHLSAAHLREDLHYNALLLHLICHYELGNYSLLDYLLPSVQRTFRKGSDITDLPRATLQFLRQLVKVPLGEQTAAFRKFHLQLQRLLANPYEKKAINYFDIPAWVARHLQSGVVEKQ